MCTISWHRSDKAYTVLFNRDEQRTRKEATPPECLKNGVHSYLAALDGEAGGTWLAVNSSGLSVAILNFYQHDEKVETSGIPTSRGRIPGQLMHLQSAGQAGAILQEEVQQNPYRPFLCLVIDRDAALLYSWDGATLEQAAATSPMTTSGFDSENVERGRLHYFEEHYNTADLSVEKLLEFHGSHHPEKGPYSVCMHRNDACSRSLSRVSVGPERVRYDYLPASPCQHQEEPWITGTIPCG